MLKCTHVTPKQVNTSELRQILDFLTLFPVKIRGGMGEMSERIFRAGYRIQPLIYYYQGPRRAVLEIRFR